jgi:hypothetical protein
VANLNNRHASAERRAQTGREILESQHKVVAGLKTSGAPFVTALLRTFEEIQGIFEQDLREVSASPGDDEGFHDHVSGLPNVQRAY